MSETKPSAEEVMESLTGFDEMAIQQHFGRNISELPKDQTMMARALIFVLKRRDGVTDDDARNETLFLPIKDVVAYFADDEDAEEADQELGKDDESSLGPQLVTSPLSAS